jgi:hypothetical protein
MACRRVWHDMYSKSARNSGVASAGATVHPYSIPWLAGLGLFLDKKSYSSSQAASDALFFKKNLNHRAIYDMMKLQGKGPTNRNSTQMIHFQFSSTNSYMHFNVYLCFVKSSTSKYPQPSLSFFLPQIKHTHTHTTTTTNESMNVYTHFTKKETKKKHSTN